MNNITYTIQTISNQAHDLITYKMHSHPSSIQAVSPVMTSCLRLCVRSHGYEGSTVERLYHRSWDEHHVSQHSKHKSACNLSIVWVHSAPWAQTVLRHVCICSILARCLLNSNNQKPYCLLSLALPSMLILTVLNLGLFFKLWAMEDVVTRMYLSTKNRLRERAESR